MQEIKLYLHSVEQSRFVHVVHVRKRVLVQDPPNFGPLRLNMRHIDKYAFSKAAIRTGPMKGLKGIKQAIGKFESDMIRMQTFQYLPFTLFKYIAAHVDTILIGMKPLCQSLLHLRIFHFALAFMAEIDVVCHFKQLCRAVGGN